jgi:hypothetical protein
MLVYIIFGKTRRKKAGDLEFEDVLVPSWLLPVTREWDLDVH